MHSLAAILALAFFLPQTPDPTLPPATAHAQYTVVGEGVQVYRCEPISPPTTPTPITLQWVFQGPRATLFDTTTKLPIGKHSASHTMTPNWTWNDASEIIGIVLAKQPSPDPNAIPWLLLEARSIGATGALSNIKYVRRSNTQAGAAPTTGCNAAHLGNIISVPYAATYTFYTAN